MKNNKLKSWFENKFVPVVGKLGNQRHLASIRDGFAIFTPILIAGALAILFNQSIFSHGGGNSTKGTLTGVFMSFNDFKVTSGGNYYYFLDTMKHIFTAIQMATIQVMSVYVAFGVAYFISSSRNNNTPVIAGLVGLASFLVVTPLTPGSYAGWQASTYWLSANGLISAILVSLLAGELFCFLSKGNKLAIKMPPGVPPAVSRAFAKLFPAIIVLGLAAGISTLVFWLPFYVVNIHGKAPVKDAAMLMGTTTTAHIKIASLTQPDIDSLRLLKLPESIKIPKMVLGGAFKWDLPSVGGDNLAKLLNLSTPATTSIVDAYLPVADASITTVIYAAIVNPFVGAASSTAGALGFAFAYVMLISFFWFFGLHGTNIINGAFNPLWLILYAKNVNGAQNVFVQGTFDAFIFIGGWGVTLALVLATLIFGNRKSPHYEASKFSLAPGLFNINEPVTFGYPLVLNGMLVIPLFLVMPTLVFTTYAATEWFGVPVTKTIMPWTTPVGFGGLIATGSPWGFVLALANLGIAFAIYTPFVFLQKVADKRHGVKVEKKSEQKVEKKSEQKVEKKVIKPVKAKA